MSDGSNDFELFKGPAAKEKDEKSDEKFQEEMRKAQQAMANLQKEEGHAKGYDFTLASILIHFLGQPQNTDLFILVSRVIALNIPSEFIIAILALVDKKAQHEVQGLLSRSLDHKGIHSATGSALALRHAASFQTLQPELKKEIEHWVANLTSVAGKCPDRMLDTMLVPGPDHRIAPVLSQLCAIILRNYLASHRAAIGFEDLRDFMEAVLAEIAKNMAQLLRGQKKLSEHTH